MFYGYGEWNFFLKLLANIEGAKSPEIYIQCARPIYTDSYEIFYTRD